jgi:hypothetical protein
LRLLLLVCRTTAREQILRVARLHKFLHGLHLALLQFGAKSVAEESAEEIRGWAERG